MFLFNTDSPTLSFVHDLIYFQALFYMFIFRHKQLLDLEEGGTIVKSFCNKFQSYLIMMDDCSNRLFSNVLSPN